MKFNTLSNTSLCLTVVSAPMHMFPASLIPVLPQLSFQVSDYFSHMYWSARITRSRVSTPQPQGYFNNPRPPILSFPTKISKGFFLRVIKPFPNKPWFVCVCNARLLKTLWEREQFLLFPQCFLPIWRAFYHFHQN